MWPIIVATHIAAPMVPSVLTTVDGPPQYTSVEISPPPQYTAVFGPRSQPPSPGNEVDAGPRTLVDETDGFLFPPVYSESDS